MKVTRRGFLGFSLAAGLLGGAGALLSRLLRPSPLSRSEVRALEAYLDTLIPPDETPGAVELGVAGKLISKAAVNRHYRKLLQRGCRWLDDRARREGADGFAALGEADRERLVSLADAMKGGLAIKIFFERTREDAVFYYYADPRSWRGLGFPGPPQPMGFMNYTQAPTRRHG